MGRSCPRTTSLWSNLSHELIFSISRLLTTPSDILAFRRVCKKWRNHSIPPSPNILNPLLPHPIPTFNCPVLAQANSNSGSFVIAARPIYLFNENQPSWVVMAEEVNPGKIELRHPLTGKLLNCSATTLHLSHFKVSAISKGYNLLHSNLSVFKVLLHSNSASHRQFPLNDCAALVLHDYGIFGALRLVVDGLKCNWYECGLVFDDFVIFKGMIVAVNCFGRLIEMAYDINYMPSLQSRNILTEGFSYSGSGNRRKRLVVDPLCDKLYLVLRQDVPLKLCVYVLNQQLKRWENVKTFGRYKVLFVGVDQCFFASARDFPGCSGIGNSIVFTDNAFPRYGEFRSTSFYRSLFHDGYERDRIMVYKLKEDAINFVSDNHGLSQIMGHPPEWFSSTTRNFEAEEKQSDSNSQEKSSSFCEEIDASSFEAASKKSSYISSTSSARRSGTLHEAEVSNINVEATNSETPRDGIDPSDIIIDAIQNDKSYTTIKFEELEIRSTLVPTLQKIWLKYGNIVKNIVICNRDIVARTLESVATAVLILEGNSVGSLSDGDAHYLKSALSDFRHMNLDIDWLAHAIENALALQKNKSLIDSLNCLWKAKDKAEKMRLNLLGELAKLDEMMQELDDNISMVLKTIPVTGQLDMDQPLVEGLT